MAQAYRIVPLDPGSDRSTFHCGVEALDRYFHEQVTQDIRRRVTTCFVAVNDQATVAGFYTLASASVFLADLPGAIAKKLPRFPTVPAIRMGRLAIDLRARGQKLGAALLADALARTLESGIAAFALVADAKDDKAVAFYRHHGFIALTKAARTPFLPLPTVKSL